MKKRVIEVYKHHPDFSHNDYEALLVMMRARNEMTPRLEDCATKLIVVFGSLFQTINYFQRNSKENYWQAKKIEDAASFVVPNNFNWDLKSWQALVIKQNPKDTYDKVFQLLQYADLIESVLLLESDIPKKIIKTYLAAKEKHRLKLKYEILISSSQKKSTQVHPPWQGNFSEFLDQELEKNKKNIKFLKRKYLTKLIASDTPLGLITLFLVYALYGCDLKYLLLAQKFYKVGLHAEEFEAYCSLKPKQSDLFPDYNLEGGDITASYQDYYFAKVATNDLRLLFAGKSFLDNCYHWGGAGKKAIKMSITSQDYCFYAIFKKTFSNKTDEDPIVALAWTWRNQDKLVCDSIDVNKQYHKNIMIGDFFFHWARDMVHHHGFESVSNGCRDRTPAFFQSIRMVVGIPNCDRRDGYLDSVFQSLLAHAHYPIAHLYKQLHATSQLAVKDEITCLKTLEQVHYWTDLCVSSGLDEASLALCSMLPEHKQVALTRMNNSKALLLSVDLADNNSYDRTKNAEDELISKINPLLGQVNFSFQMREYPIPFYLYEKKWWKALRLVLERGEVDVNLVSREGGSILSWLIKDRKSDLLKIWLAKKPPLNRCDQNQHSPIHLAIANIEILTLLIAAGFNPNFRDNIYQRTLIWDVINAGVLDIGMLTLLINNLSPDNHDLPEAMQHLAASDRPDEVDRFQLLRRLINEPALGLMPKFSFLNGIGLNLVNKESESTPLLKLK